jgi:hypothetical protein
MPPAEPTISARMRESDPAFRTGSVMKSLTYSSVMTFDRPFIDWLPHSTAAAMTVRRAGSSVARSAAFRALTWLPGRPMLP